MDFKDYYLNVPLLKTFDTFERELYMDIYNKMMIIYSDAKEEQFTDYYEPLIKIIDFDKDNFKKPQSMNIYNKLSIFTHYYNNLKINNILVDKREITIDKILK